MKKYTIMALAVFMIAAFTLPAYALENEFGGFFDTRFQTRKYYDGFDRTDPGGYDDTDQNVEQRTRLYYTAKINDNLKLVNKFEMDATWGKSGTYGDIGADEIAVEVKNTYIDFNVGPTNWTVGTQNYDLFRSFYIGGKDASGVIARWKVMDNFVLAAAWLKAFEADNADSDTLTNSDENDDIDSYTVTAAFWFNENISIKPSINWLHTSDATEGIATVGGSEFSALAPVAEGADIFTFGFDFDMNFDKWSAWVTAIGQDGTLDTVVGSDIDFKGYLFAVGGNVMLGGFDIYGEAAYASGDDDDTDSDFDEFFNPQGAHGWAELLADGTLWNGSTAGGQGLFDRVRNIFYIGGGVKFSPMDKLTINPAIWYAQLDEDNDTGESDIGTEVDIKITYKLVEGLNLELIGAYLFAGDAFSDQSIDNEEDPYEYGLRLSMSF